MENKYIVPIKYTKGFLLCDDDFDDLEEESLTIEMNYIKNRDINPKEMIRVLELFYSGDFKDLKMKINQQGLYFLLYGYLKTTNYEKFEKILSEIMGKENVDTMVIINNLLLTGGMITKTVKNYIKKSSNKDKLVTYYLQLCMSRIDRKLYLFISIIENIIKNFGVTPITKCIFKEIRKVLFRDQVYNMCLESLSKNIDKKIIKELL